MLPSSRLSDIEWQYEGYTTAMLATGAFMAGQMSTNGVDHEAAQFVPCF
jgi:hypothetical protein